MAKAEGQEQSTKQSRRESDESRQQRGYVQYIGPSDARVIYASDWQQAGINHPDLIWNKANGWRVKRSDISDEAYVLGIANDRELILIEPEE